jgi:predicted PurR-regulated permease PerM
MGFDFSNDISNFLKGVLNATLSTFLMLVMIPIYTALFLYHRGSFVKFLEAVIGQKHKDQLHDILNESIFSYFNFIKGNFYVYCIVGILNSIGLLALGIKHAILYGVLTSFMMVIPYVGIFISASIPVSIALVTKDSIWYPIGVIMIFVFIQYLESNVFFPAIVGKQLNLSTWATLVAIVGGVIFWGIPGMVLITPFLAILKIISDHVPSMHAINILLNRKEGFQ